MKKDDSLALKGVAILMMLMLHLFFSVKHGEYVSFITIFGIPLIERFSALCNPVPLFLIISGYGLYSSYTKKGNIEVGRRTFNLYVHLWIIYLIFIPIGHFIKPESYPGDLLCFLGNITSYRVTYNGEQWFLLPYIIILLCSKWIFGIVDRLKPTPLLGITLAIYVIYCISIKLLGGVWNYIGHGGYWIFSALGFLFPFTIGACMKKYNWCEEFAERTINIRNSYPLFPLLLLFCIIGVRFVLNNYSFQVFAVAFLFMIFPTFNISGFLKKTLMYLGKHSMNIWLIHSYFCYYLFRDFIYGLKYPLLMFVVTLCLSLLASIIVEFLFGLLKSQLIKHNITLLK